MIQRDYQIVASVRSPSKADAILSLHPSWKGKVAFVYVADIAALGAFDDVFKSEKVGFDYIIHTASPVSFNVQDVKRDLIDPAVKGWVYIPSSRRWEYADLRKYHRTYEGSPWIWWTTSEAICAIGKCGCSAGFKPGHQCRRKRLYGSGLESSTIPNL